MQTLKSWLLANSISLPNFDFIALRVAASSGSFLGADATAPVERAEAMRVTRSVLYMQQSPFQRLACVMTTPVAFRDWYELPASSAEDVIRTFQLAHSRSKVVIFASRFGDCVLKSSLS
jgi:hypothetical protein